MLKVLGNYDAYNSYISTRYGTCLAVDNNLGLINAPWNTIAKRLVDIENTTLVPDQFISVTSNIFDRISGLSTYLKINSTAQLIVPTDLKTYLDLSSLEFNWIDLQYKPQPTVFNERIVELHPVLNRYTDALNQTDLYNSLNSLTRNKVIYVYQLPQYSVFTGFISLYNQYGSKIQRYAQVIMKVSQDNTVKELYIVVDYPYSDTVVKFFDDISPNFNAIKFVWYFDQNDKVGSDKLTLSEFNKLPTDIKNNTILVDDNDGTKIGLNI